MKPEQSFFRKHKKLAVGGAVLLGWAALEKEPSSMKHSDLVADIERTTIQKTLSTEHTKKSLLLMLLMLLK